MRTFLSALALISVTFFGMQQAEAYWECVYSCGSKGQEQKVGRGWSQREASRNAQQYTCTKYEGGRPKYFQGCQYVDQSGGGGGHDDGGWQPPRHRNWQCVYACGSKGQEQKVGYGRSQREATRNARGQVCTKYSGGYPQYYVGCQAN